MDFLELIQTFGLAVAALIAVSIAGYKLLVRWIDENKSREERFAGIIAESTKAIRESNEVNRELTETNRKLVEEMTAKINSVDSKVDKVLDRLK